MQEIEIFDFMWWIITLGVFFAAYVRGIAGFAFGLILTPILLITLSPQFVIIINLTLSILLNTFSLIVMRKFFLNYIEFKKLFTLIVGSIIGMPFGTYVLKIIDPEILKVCIAVIIIFFSILLKIGYTLSFKNKISYIIIGYCSGFLMTSTGLGGPPIVLFMHGQRLSKEIIYCNLSIYWLFSTTCSLIILYFWKVANINLIFDSLSFVPGLLIGLNLGIITFHKINNKFFIHVTIFIVIISGINAILSGLGIL